MLDSDQRRLLGDFIRAHRERAQPEASGGRRRRTPGLRREELAARAGISATWCAWLEQGRPVQASPEALDRMAKALSLGAAERAYLFELAGRVDPLAPQRLAADAPASLRSVVDIFPHPAYGLDACWNACCWNEPAARLFHGWLDGCELNLLRFVFKEDAKRLIPDWEERAKRLLAEFRADFGHVYRNAQVRSLIETLRRESPSFDAAWNAQDVQRRQGGPRAFTHSELGTLWFEQRSYIPADAPSHKLVLLVPATPEP